MTKSYLRGHEIECVDGKCLYCDTGDPTVINGEYQMRDCGFCGKANTKEGHDGCLGTLPGIMNACCGHGQVNEAYVQFLDSFVVKGSDAMKIMEILKKNISKTVI